MGPDAAAAPTPWSLSHSTPAPDKPAALWPPSTAAAVPTAATLYCLSCATRRSLLTAGQNLSSSLLSRSPSLRCAGYLLDKTILAEKPLVEGLLVPLVMPLLHALFDKSLVAPPCRPNLAAELAEDLLRIDFDRTDPTQVCADTAPSVPPRIDGHFQSSRIEMDIAHQFKQIRISIAQYRFVTALKQVADLAMAPVISLRVAELDPLHDLGKRHAFGLILNRKVYFPPSANDEYPISITYT